MKDRSAHSGGGATALRDEFPIAQEEGAGDVEDKEGFELASEEAGGTSNSLIWFGLGWGFLFFFCFFCFVLSGGFGEKGSLGFPTMSARARQGSEMGILRKARRCPAKGSGKAAAGLHVAVYK